MFVHRAVSRLLAAVSAVALLSCTDAPRPGPTQPTGPRASVSTLTAGDPAIVPQVNALIDQIFTSLPRRQQAHQHFDQLVEAWARGAVSGATGKLDIIVAQTLDQLAAGHIADPDGSGPLTPVTGTLTLFNLLYAYVGASSSIVPIDGNTYVALVQPNANDQTFTSGLGATVIVPGGGTSQTALLYIQRQPTAGDLASGLSAGSDPYEVHFIPEIDFTTVTVAICADQHDLPMGSTRLAHELDDGTVEILPPVFVGVFCSEAQTSEATPALPPHGMLARARLLARGALRVFGATPAFAGHSATGATLPSLSPLQVVVAGTRLTTTASGGAYGGSATVNATLTDVAGAALAAKTLALTVDGIARGTASTDAAGAASFTVGGLAVGSHAYVVSFAAQGYLEASSASGTFSVGTAALTLTASSATVVYGATPPPCVVTYTGLVNGDTKSSIGSVSTCSFAGLPPGTSSVMPTAIAPAPANYTVTTVAGTFTATYNTAVGHGFTSPLSMREIRRGSKIPLKFQLFMADGVTPITTGTFTAYVTGGSPAVTLGPLGTFSYKAGTWELSVDSGTWPLGVVTIYVDLGDGSRISVQEIIK